MRLVRIILARLLSTRYHGFIDLVDVTPEGKIIFAVMESDQLMAVYPARSPRVTRYRLFNIDAIKAD